MRELFLAARVGATADLDAVLIALVLPTALAGVATSGIVRASAPAYMEAGALARRDEVRRLCGALIIWVGVAGLAVSVALAHLLEHDARIRRLLRHAAPLTVSAANVQIDSSATG